MAAAGDPPTSFAAALASLRDVRLRPEVVVEEAPAPQRLAPHAVALTAEVVVADEELGTGRFVLLHDPAGHEAWDGAFRAVTFVRATLEPEIVSDPMLPSVGWAWLLESLESCGAEYRETSGTVTRVASESFGVMVDRGATAEIEIRASWTPVDHHVGPHLRAWAQLLCTAAGLPPVPPGVVAMPSRRGVRGR